MQPKIVVAMGAEALAALNDLQIPLARPLAARLGEIQQLTPSIDALYVPNIDESLDGQEAKRAFWEAFRALGEWWAAQPPMIDARGSRLSCSGGRMRPPVERCMHRSKSPHMRGLRQAACGLPRAAHALPGPRQGRSFCPRIDQMVGGARCAYNFLKADSDCAHLLIFYNNTPPTSTLLLLYIFRRGPR